MFSTKKLARFWKGQKIRKFNTNSYEYFDSKFDYDSLVLDYRIKGTFLSISKMVDFDAASVTEICSFVRHGNNAFISSEMIPNALLDSLNLKMESEYKYSDSIYNWVANKNWATKNTKSPKASTTIISPKSTRWTRQFGLSKWRQHEGEFHKSQL